MKSRRIEGQDFMSPLEDGVAPFSVRGLRFLFFFSGLRTGIAC